MSHARGPCARRFLKPTGARWSFKSFESCRRAEDLFWGCTLCGRAWEHAAPEVAGAALSARPHGAMGRRQGRARGEGRCPCSSSATWPTF